MTHNPTWPLNEPIETNAGDTAVIYEIFGSEMFGRIERLPCKWALDGTNPNQSKNLIPPKPARQYGYAVWTEDCSWAIFDGLKSAHEYSQGARHRSGPITLPIPRPGETLCVRPSPEAVRKAIAGKIIKFSGNVRPEDIDTSGIEKAFLALLDGEA